MGFAYDANGRQIKATQASVSDALTVYDALGNRVATKVNDIWQYVVYDAFGKLIAEYGLASGDAGGVKYIQQDWQGSPRTVTSNNGNVVSRTDHQAFGEDIGAGTGIRSAVQGYSGSSSTTQGYGSTENDSGSGQQHTAFRKLETRAGRWSSPDPYKGSMSMGYPQSFNRYSYVGGDPVNFIDPSGLFYSPPRPPKVPDWGFEIPDGFFDPAPEVQSNPGGGSQDGAEAKSNAISPESFSECIGRVTAVALNRFTNKITKKLGIAIATGGLLVVTAIVVGAVLAAAGVADPEPISKTVATVGATVVITGILYYLDAYSDATDDFNEAVEDAQEKCKDKPGAPASVLSGAAILKILKG